MKVLFVLLIVTEILPHPNKPQQEFNYNFQQNDYNLVPEHMDLVRYNKDYVKKIFIRSFKYNRTTTANNLTFLFNVDMGNRVEVIAQAYKFMSNEYRHFPMRVQVNACKAINANILGARRNSSSCGNFTGCPIFKGKTYHICNWVADQSKMPPFIPNGRYKLQMQVMFLGTEIFVLDAYAGIDRPYFGVTW